MFVVTAATGAAVALHPILVAGGEHLSLQQHCGIPFGHHWGLTDASCEDLAWIASIAWLPYDRMADVQLHNDSDWYVGGLL